MNKVVTVEKLSKNFYIKKGLLSKQKVVHAVKDISFDVYEGDVFGLIGESGSGKTTTSNMIVKNLAPTSGSILYKDIDISKITSPTKLKSYRKDVQMVFQQSKEVLDPLISIDRLIKEPLIIHNVVPKDQVDKEVNRILGLVGLDYKEKQKKTNEFSGGQIQRLCIARALAVRPKLLLLDEPVAALDVSVQGQIINLLMDLRDELNLTYLMVSHDLNVVKHMCNRIAIMKNGEIVEIGITKDIFEEPKDSYTKQLLESM